MSQYPSPYSPPPQYPGGYYPAPPDPLAPAKRASLMMFILGPLVILAGTCLSLFASALNQVTLQPDQQQAIDQVEKTTGVPAHTLFMAAGVVMFVVGLLIVVLGLFVRRGGMGATITSCIVTALILLWLGMNLLGAALHPMGASAGLGICFGVGIFILFGGLLALLVAAARAARGVAAGQQQLQAQYWQYQQNMQSYGGYHAPMTPPPPPPPSAPPSGDQNQNGSA
ncbi:MAG TPA: hypothetical protein VLI90_09250 [Tepidisphaeraceae bacterium]|nr:hypothetical protein [Tepidisphaeraceae bacterium]